MINEKAAQSCSAPPGRREQDFSVNWMLIDFINQKKKEAKLSNREIARFFGTKNPAKFEYMLEYFGRTGELEPHRMKRLGEILNFTMAEVDSVHRAFNALVYEDQTVFMENFPLILNYSDLITGKREYSNITFRGLAIGITFVARSRPLTIGELFTHYRNGHLIDDNGCCGRVYIFAAGGSILSGGHQYTGICSGCNSVVYGTLRSFRLIMEPFLKFQSELPCLPSPMGIKELIEDLHRLEQKKGA